MQSSTYVSRRPGPFAALIQTATLGEFRLSPLAPVRVRDQYWDTADGELLRTGLALRVRETDGERTAALRALSGAVPDAARVPDVPLAGDAISGDSLRLPPGLLAEALADRVGADPLRPLLALRQYRTPRIAYDGDRAALLVSLDVVVYEVPGAQVVSNEVEVEITAQGGPDDVERLDPHLRGYDLRPEARTKLERGLLRITRDLADPILLLPDERSRLEHLAERGDTRVRRRARVLLLDARGYRADTVAGQTGLSVARVRQWKERFAQDRLAIFDAPEADAPEADAPEADAPEADAPEADAPEADAPEADASPSALPDAPSPSAEAPYRVRELVDLPGSPPRPGAEVPSGDAAGDGDIGGLLELFTPTNTETPFLDQDDLGAEEEADDIGLDEDEPSADDPETGESDRSDSVGPEGPRDAAPLRRPALTAETPLLDAAFVTLVYHVARFEDAAVRLGAGAGGTPEDARRVLLAAHRVRLAVEAFAPFVPAMAAGRIVAALRPLVGALDAVLDFDRAGHEPARDRALAEARAMLAGGRHRAWGPRARRLLDRLGAQHADGLLIGDDFPAPPDDLVGQPGDVPVPSRLRHAAASMLWARYEAIRAFEDDLDGPPTADLAHHLALAVSGLHFVLGIAASASAASARDLAARLDAAEARLAACRHTLRTAEIAGTEPDTTTAVADVWADLASDDVRRALADVVAGI